MSWQDWLGNLSGYKPLYDNLLLEMQEAEIIADQIIEKIGGSPETNSKFRDKLSYILTQADAFDNYPIPVPPFLDYDVIKSQNWVYDQVAYIIARGMRFYPLDSEYRLTTQSNWLNVILWDWTDQKEYIREWWDCEDFAISFWLHCRLYLKLNSCAFTVDYSSQHGYDLLIYADGKKMIHEPQTDTITPLSERNMNMYNLSDGMFTM